MIEFDYRQERLHTGEVIFRPIAVDESNIIIKGFLFVYDILHLYYISFNIAVKPFIVRYEKLKVNLSFKGLSGKIEKVS